MWVEDANLIVFLGQPGGGPLRSRLRHYESAWAEPDHRMQHVVASAVEVAGAKRFDKVLPQPQRPSAFFGDGESPPEKKGSWRLLPNDIL